MKININGYAQHGKDTVGEIFADTTQSEPYNVSHDIAKAIHEEHETLGPYNDWLEAYEDRVNHRDEWFNFIREKRDENPIWLIDVALDKSGMYIGHRSLREFEYTKPLVDATIWVDASRRGLPKEPVTSCELTPEDHDYVIDNGGYLWETRQQVEAVVQLIKNRKRAINAY